MQRPFANPSCDFLFTDSSDIWDFFCPRALIIYYGEILLVLPSCRCRSNFCLKGLFHVLERRNVWKPSTVGSNILQGLTLLDPTLTILLGCVMLGEYEICASYAH